MGLVRRNRYRGLVRVFVLLYLVFNLVYTIWGFRVFKVGGIGLSIGIFIFLSHSSASLRLLFIVLVIITSFSLKSLLYEDFYLTGYIPVFSLFVGSALYELSTSQSDTIFKWISFTFSGFLIYCIYMLYYGEVEPGNIVYYSRNSITTVCVSLFLVLNVVYSNVKNKKYKKINVLIIGISIGAVCVYTGRTGLVVGFVVLLVSIFKYSNKYVATLVLSFGLLYMYMKVSFIAMIENMPALARLFEKGAEGPRWYIWSSVLEQIGSPRHIFGLDESLSKDLTGYSWHNGYLQAYSMFGLLGTSLLFYLISKILYYSFMYSFSIGVLVLLTLGRAFFDDVLIDPYILPVLIFVYLVTIHKTE